MNGDRYSLVVPMSSTSSGFYQEFRPAPDLTPFVACTWVRVVRCSVERLSDAILPDGCADIMMYDDHPPHVAGPDAITRRTTLGNGLTIAGIRLRPGACRAVLGCSASEIVNGGAILSELSAGTSQLHRALLDTRDLNVRLSLLESWVRTATYTASDNDRTVIAACRMLARDATHDVGDVAQRCDWSVRKIHRQFVAACGYGPKHFQRIMRVQRALRFAATPGRRGLADLALVSGYADQSHMVRDFRQITGFKPSHYLAEARLTGWGEWMQDW